MQYVVITPAKDEEKLISMLQKASEEDLGVALDKVRAQDKILRLLQLESAQGGEIFNINKAIAWSKIQQENASRADYINLNNQIQGWQDILAKIELYTGGLGAAEEIAWDIAMAERDLQNAAEGERDAIKETLVEIK